jgi:hypothetical protein
MRVGAYLAVPQPAEEGEEAIEEEQPDGRGGRVAGLGGERGEALDRGRVDDRTGVHGWLVGRLVGGLGGCRAPCLCSSLEGEGGLFSKGLFD